MSGRDDIAVRARAFRDLEDPIARLQQLVIVAHKFQETVLEYRPEVAEMLSGMSEHIGRVIAISDDDHDALDFIMLELVYAIRALHDQYFSLGRGAASQGVVGARS